MTELRGRSYSVSPAACSRHAWANESGQVLACTVCGVPWPGAPLPRPLRTDAERPEPRVQGERWNVRVRRMTAELAELDEPARA